MCSRGKIIAAGYADSCPVKVPGGRTNCLCWCFQLPSLKGDCMNCSIAFAHHTVQSISVFVQS